jgi:hypothetical protein
MRIIAAYLLLVEQGLFILAAFRVCSHFITRQSFGSKTRLLRFSPYICIFRNNIPLINEMSGHPNDSV